MQVDKRVMAAPTLDIGWTMWKERNVVEEESTTQDGPYMGVKIHITSVPSPASSSLSLSS